MQVVWASSKKFGIGKATTTLDNMLCTWVVGLYDPSGDMRNMQKENVLIGLFDYTYCDTFGKGGGGKGSSSGAIHNFADDKVAIPAGSDLNAKKKSGFLHDLSTKRSKEKRHRVKFDHDLVDYGKRSREFTQSLVHEKPKRRHRVMSRGM